MRLRHLASEIAEEKEVKTKEDIPRENPNFLEMEIERQKSNWMLDQNMDEYNKSGNNWPKHPGKRNQGSKDQEQ